MAGELETNVPDTQPAQVENQPSLTAIEQRALDQGWVPKDEWAGEPDDWRPAREFLDRGELFKKIDDQNRTIKDLKRAQADFAKHHEKVREIEFKRALESLKAQKKEALAEGDADAVIDIDDKIAETREAMRTPQPVTQPVESPVNPIFEAWVNKNAWYHADEAMQAYADRIGNKLGAAGGMSPTDILSEVERQVKEKFSHKFQNPRRQSAPAVEGSATKGAPVKDNFQLTAEERQVMQRYVRLGVMTEAKYIEDLKKIKGVS